MSLPLKIVVGSEPKGFRRLTLFFLLVVTFFAPGVVCSEELHLWQKNPANWEIVADGARGIIIFSRETGFYQFRGQGLRESTEYVLVRGTETPPFGNILARGMSTAAGQLELAGRWNNWQGKIWLVPGGDIAITSAEKNMVKLKAWRPQNYLFETRVLTE